MLLLPRRCVPLVVVVAMTAALAPSSASACVDAGVTGLPPDPSPTEPFDAGPGCTTVPDSCGRYHAVCEPDASTARPDGAIPAPHDAGPPPPLEHVCSPYVDSGRYVPYEERERYACSATSECAAHDPGLTCGSDGFCACAPPPARGCSVSGARAADMAWPLVLFAAAALYLARRRREPASTNANA